MTDILVHHAELSIMGSQAIYVASVQHEPDHDNGAGEILTPYKGHLIPAECFESRAAEYGIDPDSATGWDQLLKLVLIGDPTPGSIEQKLTDPDHLFNAPTVAHARRAYLKKINTFLGKRKLRGVPGPSACRGTINQATAIDNSGTDNPLEFIQRTAPMSAEHIAVKQEYVSRVRSRVRAKRERRGLVELRDIADITTETKRDMKLSVPRESAEKLAQRLLGNSGWGDDSRLRQRSTGINDYRDENDLVRNRLPARVGQPSKYL